MLLQDLLGWAPPTEAQSHWNGRYRESRIQWYALRCPLDRATVDLLNGRSGSSKTGNRPHGSGYSRSAYEKHYGAWKKEYDARRRAIENPDWKQRPLQKDFLSEFMYRKRTSDTRLGGRMIPYPADFLGAVEYRVSPPPALQPKHFLDLVPARSGRTVTHGFPHPDPNSPPVSAALGERLEHSSSYNRHGAVWWRTYQVFRRGRPVFQRTIRYSDSRWAGMRAASSVVDRFACQGDGLANACRGAAYLYNYEKLVELNRFYR